MLAALLLGAAPAGAQVSCAPRADVVAELARVHGECQVMAAVMEGGQRLLEIFATEDGRTWTAYSTRPDGTMCFLASGTDLHMATKGRGA